MALLEVKNLNVSFQTSQGLVHVLRDVNFSLEKGESLGIVGESGSGKSVTSLALFDLLASNARINSGEINFDGRNILTLAEKEKQKIRGSKISMIFQDPMSSLNPCYTVEDQISEVLRFHTDLAPAQRREKCIDLLKRVGIPDPVSRLGNFPHELSGGMSQRVMIAMAIACSPKVLIADEPTTALDVTIQKQILELLRNLQKQNEMSLILISHDLGVISSYTEKLMVMYAGEVVEQGSSQAIMRSPSHPYTEGLLRCLPAHYQNESHDFRLPTIQGVVPHLGHRPKGCQLAPRCQYRKDACENKPIQLRAVSEVESGSWIHKVRCDYPLSIKEQN